MNRRRLTASSETETLSVFAAAGLTASATSRTLAGHVVRFNELGRTSAGPLRVRPGALRFPEDLSRVKLTFEHDRARSRGHMVSYAETPEGIHAAMRVSDGPEGDAAIREAKDKTRDGFSFDVVDHRVVDGWIEDGLVVAIGQVGIPAYDETRIDAIAASQTPGTNPGSTEGDSMTPEQRARLDELKAKDNLTEEERAELTKLEALAKAEDGDQAQAASPAPAAQQPTAVAASMPAVPAGVPAVTASASADQRNPLDRFLDGIVDGYTRQRPDLAITAALADVTYAQHGGTVAMPAWSGELWSGLDFEPEFTSLLEQGTLTALEGKGWRFKTKPEMKDYAGNKAEIPTTTIETEPSSWTAARMAVGNDFDRAFYDFPEAYRAVLEGYVKFVRLSWAQKLDAKVLAWIVANAVPAAGVPAQTSVLKAAALAIRVLKHRKVGKADWVLMNDDDHFTLFDLNKDDVPAFLDLFDLTPSSIKSSPDVPQGKVLAGKKQTAEVKTLPGSPIRVDAQHLSHGGIDTAFFGYWAIEAHHTQGIASVDFEPA